MPTSVLFWLLVFVVLATVSIAAAQQPTKMSRIGILSAASDVPPMTDAFQQRLRKYGYVEGRNVLFERRFAAGNIDLLPTFALELLGLKPDVVVAVTNPAVVAMKKASATVPIVMVAVADPVGTGLIASLARPGGNVTGTSNLAVELSGKRMELLKETVPKLTHVAVMWNSADSGMTLMSKRIRMAAQELNVAVEPLEVRDAKDIESALAAVGRNRPGAFFMIADRLTATNGRRVIDFAISAKLPSMFEDGIFASEGGLMAYGPDRPEMWRRAAYFADKILKGAKPADLPVEQPMKFQFLINLKTAKAIGLTIPPSVLYRADKVIR